MIIDHIDRNPSNNRIENLRAAGHSLNVVNSRTRQCNTSGRTGVYWYKRLSTWRVDMCGKTLGYFKSREDADAARLLAESKFLRIAVAADPRHDGME
jgi:hypothetical protein